MTSALLRVVLFLALLACHATLKAESVSRTPPDIFRRQLVPLLTPLEQVLAGRDAFPKADSHGVVLLDETICYRDASGTDYRLYHDIYLSHDDSATEVMGNSIITYDREHESIFLITAASIRPDGTRQELDDRAAFIQTPQHEAENGLYTSNQELNLIFPKVVPGAITESIVLVRVDKPVFPGEFALRKLFAGGWPTYKTRLVLDLPDALMARVHFVAASPLIPEAQDQIPSAGRARKTWTRDRIPELAWEESAPSIEFRAPTLWLTTLDSWDQVAAWLDDLVKDRSALGPELEKEIEIWTAGLTTPREIVAKLCGVVANDVRYTGLEFGLAGYQPYPCAQVWSNRYGDCKDKANLLRALLAKKGIRSHLVLLQTERLGRIEKRSPSWRQFNHAILAVDDGAGSYYFCDPTIKHLPAGTIGRGDSARSVLVVNDRKATWVDTPDVLKDTIHYSADLVLAATGELSGWFSLKASGGDAAGYTEYYNNFDPPDRRRTLQRSLEGFFPGAEIVDLDYHPASGVVTDFEIRAYFLRKPNSASVENLAFPYSGSWLPSVGTNAKRQFPYATTRRVETLDVGITLPDGWNARQIPESISANSSVARLEAGWKNEPGRLRAHFQWQPETAEIAPGDYAIFQRSIRALRSWMEQSVQVAHGEAKATGATRTALADFPLLATGEGQLRLLAQRFPSGEKDQERRVALEQVLQWFPDDIPTCFEAKVFIALIDCDEDNAKLSLQLGDILNRYDSRVASESRAWAKYLECRARWWSAKEPAAITDLQALAANPALSGYRRSWCAYYAAYFLSEKEPSLALAYLKDFDTRPDEARENMIQLEARLLARLADPGATRQWAERITKLPTEEADGLLETAIAELIKKKSDLPESAFPHFASQLTPVLQSFPHLTKAASQLAQLKSIVETSELRRTYTKSIVTWIDSHPRTWLPKKAMPEFRDTAALLKYIDGENDASHGPAVIAGILELFRHRETDYTTFAKYLYWTAWWLHHDKLDLEFFTKLVEESYALPAEDSGNIIEIRLRYALALEADKQIPAARQIYEKIIAHQGVRPYQRVEASGELARLELKEGRTEAALAAFEIATKDHLSHRQGSEYLFSALLLNLELGHHQRGLELLQAIGKDDAKYRDAIRSADTLKYLLPLASQPEALLKFWRRQESWRPQWDKLLRKYGVSPSPVHQLPLIEDIGELQKKIAEAARVKDTTSFLRQLDLLVRTAQWAPLFTSNVCTQSSAANTFSLTLYRDLYEFSLHLVKDFPPLDEVAQRSARLWHAALLSDLNRAGEARPIARQLFEDYGASHATGAAALRIWLITAADSAELPAAIGAATSALKDGREVNDRADTVATLSDALLAKKDTAANIALISGELNHPEIIAAAATKTRLAERLELLRKDSTAGEDFSGQVRTWLKSRKLEWMLIVPPLTLDQPRYASPAGNGLYSDTSLSFNEETVCNLRLALDENKPVDLRYRAFDKVTFALGYLQSDAEDYADYFNSVFQIKSLPENLRTDILSGRVAFLLKYAHPATAEKLIAAMPYARQREQLQKAYGASFAAARVLEEYNSAQATAAFKALLSEPVGQYEHSLFKALLTRMVYAGDTAIASSLVEAATSLQTAAGFSQSANGLRLDWTRHIRRETAKLGFYAQIREIFARHCAPTVADGKNFRKLTWPYSVSSLDHATRGKAIAAYFTQNLHSDFEPETILGQLNSATSYVSNLRNLGPDLETAILSAELDDATRAQWLGAVASLSDLDTPAVRDQVTKVGQDFLTRSPAGATAQTRRVIRGQLAGLALRTSTEERPEALFGQREIRDLDRQASINLQFLYHCSRQQTAEATALMETMDADTLAGPGIFPYAQQLLEAASNQAELKLLTAAAREKLANDLSYFWIDTRSGNILQAAKIARLAKAEELLPDALFEHAISAQGDDFDRHIVRLARASLHQDWAAQRKAAQAILDRVDEYYLATFYRGEAAFHLGEKSAAKKDLELFLSKALESDLRPEATRLLAEIPKK